VHFFFFFFFLNPIIASWWRNRNIQMPLGAGTRHTVKKFYFFYFFLIIIIKNIRTDDGDASPSLSPPLYVTTTHKGENK
jgi:hypothetical protein